jgi:hypothetical protein
MVQAEIIVVGTRPLLQHAFGEDAIPLEKREREGVAGNDPGEWRRSMLVTDEGQLYIRNDYVFGCLRDASARTKKGRGSIQKDIEATLQVDPAIILLNVSLPDGDPTRDPTKPVYIDVRGVVNKATGGRNVRYRLAAAPGWKCRFILTWDKTVVSRDQMRAVLNDAGTYGGLGDGLRIGMGRFRVTSYKELTGAEEEVAEGTVGQEKGDRLATRRNGLRPVQKAAQAD